MRKSLEENVNFSALMHFHPSIGRYSLLIPC